MHVRCPHCQNPIDLVDCDPSDDVSCPSCGSSFNLSRDAETATLDSAKLKRVGRFQLLQCLGQGAFGKVWKARDMELDRIVALKLPRSEELSAEQSERFLREARAAAQVRHPNIVRVHEVGRENGRIYIASDFIDGASLDDWIGARRMTVQKSVELCAKLADALHHAHQAGVIHRDLKPQNILMSIAGEPHVTDFGLAKRAAGEITMTLEGQIVGTPAYMSPEQARGQGHTADPRSDVYSLGVILFRLLTGELPFRGQRQMLIVQILQDDPPNPRKFNAQIPRDVETICLKCLEKDPDRRYSSAAELAADLGRWSTGHPITARPVGQIERARRWCRRNSVVASLITAVVVVLMAGATVSGFFAYRATERARALLVETSRANINASAAIQRSLEAERERKRADDNVTEAMALAEQEKQQRTRADEEARRNKWLLYLSTMSQIQQSWELGQVDTVYELLQRCRPQPVSSNADNFTTNSSASDEPAFEWHYWNRRLGDHVTILPAIPAERVAWSPDGAQVATAGVTSLKLWDVKSGRMTKELRTDDLNSFYDVSWSPDGGLLAGAHDDGLVVWDLSNNDTWLSVNGAYYLCVAWRRDGQQLAAGTTKGTIDIWDVTTKAQITIAVANQSVTDLDWNPSGTSLAIVAQDWKLRIWDVTCGQQTVTVPGANRVAWSPDGKCVVTVDDNVLTMWDPGTGEAVGTLKGHSGGIECLAWNRDGTMLATGGWDQSVRIWDIENRSELKKLRAVPHPWIRDVAWGPDGRSLATVGTDRTLKIWNEIIDSRRVPPKGHPGGRVTQLEWSRDGKRLASAGAERVVRVWRTSDGRQLIALAPRPSIINSVSWKPDSTALAMASADRAISFWRFGRGWATIPDAHAGRVSAVAWGPDGRHVASVGDDGKVRLWDSEALSQVSSFDELFSGARVQTVAWSPNGKLLAAASDSRLIVCDPQNSEQNVETALRLDWRHCIAWSADNMHIALVEDLGVVKVRNVKYGLVKHRFEVPSARVNWVAFSPDGTRVAAAVDDSTVRIWHPTQGDIVTTLNGHSSSVLAVAWNHDGTQLASGSEDGTILLWDARPIE